MRRLVLYVFFVFSFVHFSSRGWSQCVGPATYTVSTTASGVNFNLNPGQLLIITSTGNITGGNINLNGGTICNQGTIGSSVNLNLNSGTFNNYGTLNRNNFTPPSGFTMNNYNIINVSGNLVINTNVNWHEDGQTTVSGNMQVNANVTGSPNICGGFIISGHTIVNSQGNLSNVDFCDLGSPAQHADVLNGTFQPSVTFCTCNFSPLPATLQSFTVYEEGYNHILQWSTATEVNNQYFTVLHSTDMIHFEELARIDGCGNCNETNSYKYVHKNTGAGVHYYQLQQTDFNGDVSELGITTIVSDKETEDKLLSMGNGQYTWQFTSVSGDALLQVMDISGRVMSEQVIGVSNEFSQVGFSVTPGQIAIVRLVLPNGSILTRRCIGF